jgi:hypothetical protein
MLRSLAAWASLMEHLTPAQQRRARHARFVRLVKGPGNGPGRERERVQLCHVGRE